MRIYVEPSEPTMPALMAAKQFILSGQAVEVSVVKFITATKTITATLTETNEGIKESWSFADSSVVITEAK